MEASHWLEWQEGPGRAGSETVSRKQEYTFIRNLELSIAKLNINVSFECKIITHALFRINYPALGLLLAGGAPCGIGDRDVQNANRLGLNFILDTKNDL